MARSLKGGDKLKAYFKDMKRQAEQANEMRVGFLENATYPDGTPVAQVASIQEYGAPSRGIPARPFFRNTIENHGPKWGDTMAALMRANGNDVQKSLAMLGEHIKGQIQDGIISLREPPNAAETVHRKGFDNPLIDTSNMLNSVDYEIGEGDQ